VDSKRIGRDMRLNFSILFTVMIAGGDAFAQEGKSSVLNIGDDAPALQLREWIKGNPIQQFEKGNVYVLEFWATWCKRCIKSMPRVSSLANQFKSHVTIIIRK